MTSPLKGKIRLKECDRKTMDRIKEELERQGLHISDEKFVAVMLNVAAQLPEEELIRLVKEGLNMDREDRESGPR